MAFRLTGSLLDLARTMWYQNHMCEVRPILEPAEGYFELGMYREAWKFIETLGPSVRTHPLAILLKIDILAGKKKWRKATALAVDGCAQWPILDSFFLKAGSCLLQQRDYHSAWDMLTIGPDSLAQKPEYYFSMARCEAQLGLWDDARASLKSCFDLDKRYREAALMETDLAPVWNAIR
jgi:predicted Zn-dependent protease